jgi:hydrogenase maturation protease
LTGAAGGNVIVCVGNSLAGDDAAGAAVYEALALRPLPPDTRLRFLGLGGIALLDELVEEQGRETHGCASLLIIVDAVQLGAVPGTVHVMEWDAIPEAGGAAVSLHGIGIRETITIGRALYPEAMPRRIVLVGIEGQRFNLLGAEMTPTVAAAIDEAVLQVMNLIPGYGTIAV